MEHVEPFEEQKGIDGMNFSLFLSQTSVLGIGCVHLWDTLEIWKHEDCQLIKPRH